MASPRPSAPRAGPRTAGNRDHRRKGLHRVIPSGRHPQHAWGRAVSRASHRLWPQPDVENAARPGRPATVLHGSEHEAARLQHRQRGVEPERLERTIASRLAVSIWVSVTSDALRMVPTGGELTRFEAVGPAGLTSFCCVARRRSGTFGVT